MSKERTTASTSRPFEANTPWVDVPIASWKEVALHEEQLEFANEIAMSGRTVLFNKAAVHANAFMAATLRAENQRLYCCGQRTAAHRFAAITACIMTRQECDTKKICPATWPM